MLVNFYRIVSSEGDEEYIGSTIQMLQKRWNQHKSKFNTNKSTCRSHVLFAKYGVDMCCIELIETCEYETLQERLKHEGELMRLSLNCVNRSISGRTPVDYRQELREDINIRKKAHYEAHKEEINTGKKAHYDANKERILTQQRTYRQRRRLARLNQLVGE